MDTTDWSGFSALHYAARRSAVSCVRLLVDSGADKSLVAASGEQAHELTSPNPNPNPNPNREARR